LAEILLKKYAIKKCYIFPPHLINASALLCEIENTEIVSFSVTCVPNIMKIRQCFLELQLKLSEMFFETQCSPIFVSITDSLRQPLDSLHSLSVRF